MEQIVSELSFTTFGSGFTDITSTINNWIIEKNIIKGILVIYAKHTSCSLTINENADPRVLTDLSCYLHSLVPEEGFRSLNDKGKQTAYLHNDEGVDDMPAHIKTALTSTSLTLSINSSKLILGTWQAVYLWEHRYSKQSRRLCLHAIGETKT